MSRILIQPPDAHDRQRNVWIGLEGDGDPSREGMGFIIGTGQTRNAAVADAVADLEAALEELQHPPFETAPHEGGQ